MLAVKNNNDIRLLNFFFRSTERLLPPQALQQKNPPPSSQPPVSSSSKRASSERSSNKNSRERSVPLKSPQPPESTKTNEDRELSAVEDFSDIGESDEEILNQDNEKAEDQEPAKVPAENEAPEEETIVKDEIVENESTADNENDKGSPNHPEDMESPASKVKESDLLEGISEEELDVSDEEKEDRVKIADALGVDWSQLITPKEVKDDKIGTPGSFRQQWTAGAIFSRIGIPSTLLKPGVYDKIMDNLNANGEKVDILHPVAFVHAYKKQKINDENQEKAKVRGTAFTAQNEMLWRRKMVGLPAIRKPMTMDIYS